MTDSLPSNSGYHIVLLRHGESVGNAQGYFQGQKDFPLTATGQAQAQALLTRWQDEGRTFDLIISSPLLRARQTAEIIAAGLDVPLELDALWLEIDNGHLAGLKQAEAQERYPRPAFIQPYQPIGETGESVWQLYLRAGQATDSLLRRTPGRYLVVSHGGILNYTLYAILGIAPQANFQGTHFRFQNAAFARLDYNPARHEWTVQAVNDRAHWTAPQETSSPEGLDRV
jgi:broad specificity phosphatase PhoE